MDSYINNSRILMFVEAKHRWKIIILQNWNDIFGSFARDLGLVKIEDNVLRLYSLNYCVAQEVFFQANFFIDRINCILNEKKIIKLTFCKRVLLAPKQLPCYKKNSTSKFVAERDIISPEALQVLAKIKSEGLRQSLQKIFLRCT